MHSGMSTTSYSFTATPLPAVDVKSSRADAEKMISEANVSPCEPNDFPMPANDAGQTTGLQPECSIWCQNQRTERHWTRHFHELKPNLSLENSGSVARDHLASERTFLAYVRTSLGCSTMGVALVQLFSLSTTDESTRFKKVGDILGVICVVLGLGVMIVGVTRYFRVQAVLLEGKFLPARHVVWIMSVILSCLIVAIFGVLVGMD